jgi:hypothetical protein
VGADWNSSLTVPLYVQSRCGLSKFMDIKKPATKKKAAKKFKRGAAGALMGRFFIGVTIVSIGILLALYLQIVTL